MAQGQGETLDTFAGLLGVKAGDRVAFRAFAKAHFAEIFASENATGTDVLASLDRLLASDPQLAVYARS